MLRLPAEPAPIASGLARDWLRRFETCDLDRVEVLFNDYRGSGWYAPETVHLLPPHLPPSTLAPAGRGWPAPIVETDPLELYLRVVEQWAAVQLQQCLLQSASAEHSARAQLMEEATQNAGRLTNELAALIQSARRQAITREMQEFATGAALLRQ